MILFVTASTSRSEVEVRAVDHVNRCGPAGFNLKLSWSWFWDTIVSIYRGYTSVSSLFRQH